MVVAGCIWIGKEAAKNPDYDNVGEDWKTGVQAVLFVLGSITLIGVGPARNVYYTHQPPEVKLISTEIDFKATATDTISDTIRTYRTVIRDKKH